VTTLAVHTLAIAAIGVLMLLAGMDRHLFVRRVSGRCPSCGRVYRNCSCH